MQFNTSRPLGKILKSHGKQGELIVRSDQDLPENFHQMESIFIEINQDVVPFFLEQVLLKTSSTAVVKLEDIDTLEEAHQLTGLTWYLPAEKPGEAHHQASDPGALQGYTLIDQDNREIGVIEDFTDIASNPLLQVRHQGHLIDIPLNEETIHFIDPERKIIKNEVPEGLLDL